MRKLIYVSGTRADFGLMSRALKLWHASEGLDVSVCVTGMHLLEKFGNTIVDIEQSGIPICARIHAGLEETTGASMAIAIARELEGMVHLFSKEKPDMVVLLGDRGEMLAGAVAASHLNIPVVHIHGGERSGTIDESVRHAISKLSHYHFVATEGAMERLIRMGELASHVFKVGAPGLDGLSDDANLSREELCSDYGFDADRSLALLLFHPVLQEAAEAGGQMDKVLQGLEGHGLQVLCLMPNADAGAHLIRSQVEVYQDRSGSDFQVRTHLSRNEFVSWLKHVDVMVGNSSSGIIEAATFGTPVINIGSRQQGRERSKNVYDVEVDAVAIKRAVQHALSETRESAENIYGDGKAGSRMLQLLLELPMDESILGKCNAY